MWRLNLAPVLKRVGKPVAQIALPQAQSHNPLFLFGGQLQSLVRKQAKQKKQAKAKNDKKIRPRMGKV